MHGVGTSNLIKVNSLEEILVFAIGVMHRKINYMQNMQLDFALLV